MEKYARIACAEGYVYEVPTADIIDQFVKATGKTAQDAGENVVKAWARQNLTLDELPRRMVAFNAPLIDMSKASWGWSDDLADAAGAVGFDPHTPFGLLMSMSDERGGFTAFHGGIGMAMVSGPDDYVVAIIKTFESVHREAAKIIASGFTENQTNI